MPILMLWSGYCSNRGREPYGERQNAKLDDAQSQREGGQDENSIEHDWQDSKRPALSFREAVGDSRFQDDV